MRCQDHFDNSYTWTVKEATLTRLARLLVVLFLYFCALLAIKDQAAQADQVPIAYVNGVGILPGTGVGPFSGGTVSLQRETDIVENITIESG